MLVRRILLNIFINLAFGWICVNKCCLTLFFPFTKYFWSLLNALAVESNKIKPQVESMFQSREKTIHNSASYTQLQLKCTNFLSMGRKKYSKVDFPNSINYI